MILTFPVKYKIKAMSPRTTRLNMDVLARMTVNANTTLKHAYITSLIVVKGTLSIDNKKRIS